MTTNTLLRNKVTLVPDATQRADHFLAIMQAYGTLLDAGVRIDPSRDPELGWLFWWGAHCSIYDNCIDDLLFPALRP